MKLKSHVEPLRKLAKFPEEDKSKGRDDLDKSIRFMQEQHGSRLRENRLEFNVSAAKCFTAARAAGKA